MERGGLGLVLRRRWRQLKDAGASTKAIVGLVVVAVVAAVVAGAVALSGSSSPAKVASPTLGSSTTVTPAGGADSTRGVTADAITVVFPVINLAAVSVNS